MLLAACQQVPVRPATSELPGVVSLNPCTDAVLAEIAEPGQILALSRYSSDPASSSMDIGLARRLGSTDGTVEELLALQPDIVLSGNFVAPATMNAMRGLGLNLKQFPIAATVDQSITQIREIANLVNRSEEGEALIARIYSALEANAPATGAEPVETIVWQSGGMVPGGNTLIADLLSRTGFLLKSAARGLGQADRLPLESVVADPPQLILASGSARSQEDRLLRHPVLRDMSGTRRIALDRSLLWCGGPTIVRAANWLGNVRRTIDQPGKS